MQNDVFSYITTEEASYKTTKIPVVEGWEWNMYDHVRLGTLYKNSQVSSGKTDDKPVKNIIKPILNVQYRAEGFDFKDILLFVDNPNETHLSLIAKKYHNKWAKGKNIDTFIDRLVESYVDFGGALVKRGKNSTPEVVPLASIAFVDQTDILSGPICLKHAYSIDKLKEMEGKWKNIDELITLSRQEKQTTQNGEPKAQTPGKYIELYELDGTFPVSWLKQANDEDYSQEDTERYSRQFYVVAFYRGSKGDKQGIVLYAGKGKEDKYKFISRDEIYNRALGLGGIEELTEAQVWTTYAMIALKAKLDAMKKTIHVTNDGKIAANNNLENIENQQILKLEDGKTFQTLQVNNGDLAPFQNAVKEWEIHAQQVGGANESLQGISPTSGTPFKLQELVVREGMGIHEYRRGKIATFVEEIYREWILPQFKEDLSKKQQFSETLELDELKFVAERMVNCEINDYIKDKILNANLENLIPTFTELQPENIEATKEKIRQELLNKGNKWFFDIAEDEMSELPIEIEINIAGKQKNLDKLTDSLVNLYRTIFADPQMPWEGKAKLINQIVEYSGLDPIDFTGYKPMPVGQEDKLKALAA